MLAAIAIALTVTLLRINAFVIAGVATEVGIEPTVRHAAGLGYIAVVATDARETRQLLSGHWTAFG
jgi:nicotinamidase-related amidase